VSTKELREWFREAVVSPLSGEDHDPTRRARLPQEQHRQHGEAPDEQRTTWDGCPWIPQAGLGRSLDGVSPVGRRRRGSVRVETRVAGGHQM
jgi:hypothetical protein